MIGKDEEILFLEEQLKKLVNDYRNRRMSHYSNQNLIVSGLSSFKEVLCSYENSENKKESLHFLIEQAKSSDFSTKIVSFVIFTLIFGTKRLDKILKEYSFRKIYPTTESQCAFFMGIPVEKYDEILFIEKMEEEK